MRKPAILAALLLSGCDYSLRIPYPRVEKLERNFSIPTMLASSSIQPSNPAFGETVTLTLIGLPADYYHSIYLSYGESGGGDPDTPSKQKGVSYYKLGNVVPSDQVATISFELRPAMGNDQNGDPFKLSRGQLLGIELRSKNIERPNIMAGLGPFQMFLIK